MTAFMWPAPSEPHTETTSGLSFGIPSSFFAVSFVYLEKLPRTGVPVTVTFSDDEKAYDSLFFLDHLTEYDWYPLFLDGNHPVTVIENRTAPAEGPTLLLVKDSFGNTLAPLLVPSYRRIVMVDPRYYRGSIADLCEERGADELLFCYSLERICTDLNLSILK